MIVSERIVRIHNSAAPGTHKTSRAGGVWCVVCGVWCVVCGVWCVVWVS